MHCASSQATSDTRSRRVRLPRSAFSRYHASHGIPNRPTSPIGDGNGSTLIFNASNTSLDVRRYQRRVESAFRVVKSERNHACRKFAHDGPIEIENDDFMLDMKGNKKKTNCTPSKQCRSKETSKVLDVSEGVCSKPREKETARNDALVKPFGRNCLDFIQGYTREPSQERLDIKGNKKKIKHYETKQCGMKEKMEGLRVSERACDDHEGKNNNEKVRKEDLEKPPSRESVKKFLNFCQDLRDFRDNENRSQPIAGIETHSKTRGNLAENVETRNLNIGDQISPAVKSKTQIDNSKSSFVNRKYYIRREKQNSEGDGQAPTYTIHIESRTDVDDSQSLHELTVTKQRVVKMRRGDIGTRIAAKSKTKENPQTEAHSLCLPAKSAERLHAWETPDCYERPSDIISPNKNISTLKKKTTSQKEKRQKSKAGLRLIDHLERKEKLQEDPKHKEDGSDQAKQPTRNIPKAFLQNAETGEQDTCDGILVEETQTKDSPLPATEKKAPVEEKSAPSEIKKSDNKSSQDVKGDSSHPQCLETETGDLSFPNETETPKHKNSTFSHQCSKKKHSAQGRSRRTSNDIHQNKHANALTNSKETCTLENDSGNEAMTFNDKNVSHESKPQDARTICYTEKQVRETRHIRKSLINADPGTQSSFGSKRLQTSVKTFQGEPSIEKKEIKITKFKPLACLDPFFNQHASSVQCRYKFKTSIAFEQEPSVSNTSSGNDAKQSHEMDKKCDDKTKKAMPKRTEMSENLRISKTNVIKSHIGRNKTENCSCSMPAESADGGTFIDMIDCKSSSTSSESGYSIHTHDMMPPVEARQNENYSNQQSSSIKTRYDDGDISSDSCTTMSPNYPVRYRENTSPHKMDTVSLKTLHKLIAEAKANSCVTVKQKDINSNFDETGSSKPGSQGDDYVSSFIGEYLLKLWKKQCLCDVKVVVGKDTFLAHKLVLAAFSDVFCPTTPQPEPVVAFNVPSSDPAAVYQIFNYIYTSSMQLNDEMLGSLLSAALFMGISEIVDIVKEILSKPTLDNFGLYIDILNDHGIHASLASYPHLYRNHFSDLLEHKKFMLLPRSDLESILSDPEVLVESEVDTITAIVNWIKYNTLDRMTQFPRLLNRVSFEVIPPQVLAALTSEHKYLFEQPGTHEVISEAFKFHALKLDDSMRSSSQAQSYDIRSINSDLTRQPCSASTCPPSDTDVDAGSACTGGGTEDKEEAEPQPQQPNRDATDNSTGHSGTLSHGSMMNRQLRDMDELRPELYDDETFYEDDICIQDHSKATDNCVPIYLGGKDRTLDRPSDRSCCFGRPTGSPPRSRHRESSVRHSLLNGQQRKWALTRQSAWTDETDDCRPLMKPTKSNCTQNQVTKLPSNVYAGKSGISYSHLPQQTSAQRTNSNNRPKRYTRGSVNRNLNNNGLDTSDELQDATNIRGPFYAVRLSCR